MQRLANVLIASADTGGMSELAEFLSDNNCNSLVCDDAREFMDEARRSQPDVVILDDASLGGEIEDLVARLNGDFATAGIPIAIAATKKTPTLMRRAVDLGVDEVFTDDVGAEEMLLRLRPVLRLSTMRAETRRRIALARSYGVEAPVDDMLQVSDAPYKVLVVGAEDLASIGMPPGLAKRCVPTPCRDRFEARDMLFDGFYDAVIVQLECAPDRSECGEFCDQIRHNPRLFNLPLLVLAARDAFADPTEPLRHGASRVLFHPVIPEDLEFSLLMLANRQRMRWALRGVIERTYVEATRDPLSCCYTMAFLEAHLDQLISAAREWQKHLTLAVFAVPAIDSVREEFGDAAADHLMRQIAQWITGLVRVEDVTARFSGHEFFLALPDTPIAEAKTVLHRIAGVLSYTDFAVEEVYRPIQVDVRMGFAELAPEDTAESLVERTKQNVR